MHVLLEQQQRDGKPGNNQVGTWLGVVWGQSCLDEFCLFFIMHIKEGSRVLHFVAGRGWGHFCAQDGPPVFFV